MQNQRRPSLRLGLGSKVFIFFSAIILISNVILYLFTSEWYARNQERRAQQYNKDLIEQYIRSTDNYFLSLDNIAHALMFNSTIQISLNQSRSDADLFRDRTYALDAIRLFEFGKKEITISIFSKNNPYRFFTVNSNIAPLYDSRTDDWFRKLTVTPKNKIIVYDNHQRSLAESARKTSPVCSSSRMRASWSTRPTKSTTPMSSSRARRHNETPLSYSTTTGAKNGPSLASARPQAG